MVKCKEIGCNTSPIFNYNITIQVECLDNKKEIIFTSKNVLFCAKHKLVGMVDVKNKKCAYKECNNNPIYNYIGSNKRLYCSSHKLEGMVDVAHKKCKHYSCKTRPSFNYKTEKVGLYCILHKLDDMINVIDRTCKYDKCNTQPTYNYINNTKRLYCASHKLSGMVDVAHKKCKTEFCDIIISNKYNGYCVRCFIYLFPYNKISRQYKIKECHVIEYIKNINVEHITFDKTVKGGCSKKRPDILIDLLTHSIIIEVDENQHMHYSCENKRIMELFNDLGSRPLVIINFNPDKYINGNNKLIQSCFNVHKKLGLCIKNENEWIDRMEKLKETILFNIKHIPNKEINIQKLYYNSTDIEIIP